MIYSPELAETRPCTTLKFSWNFLKFFLKVRIFRLSGGVSCWHLPYQLSISPQISGIAWISWNLRANAFLIWEMPATDPSRIRTFRASLLALCTAWKALKTHVIPEIWGPVLLWYGGCQQLTPYESGLLCDHFQHSVQHQIVWNEDEMRMKWKNERSKIKARAPSGRSPVPFLGKGLRPPALEARARARARARALSRKPKSKEVLRCQKF